jgi:hypothetical protein
MKLTKNEWLRTARLAFFCLAAVAALGQAPSTTTVTGTVYLANGQPGAGTLVLSWPGFTTAAGQMIAADSTTVTIPSDGFVSVNLVANQGSTPAGEYYTAVYYMSDGSAHTQYWVVPAAANATLAAVQSQVMPAAQAVQTVSKAYVDEAIAELAGSELTTSGGTLTGPLYLNGDPVEPLQAADKHYVDTTIGSGGGSGTVNSGETNQVAIYSAPGTAVSGSNSINLSGTLAGAGVNDTKRPWVDTFTAPSPGSTCGSGTDAFAQLCQLGVNADNVYTGNIFRATGCTGTTVTGSVSPFAPYLTAIPFVGTYTDTIIKLNPGCVFTVPGELDIPIGGEIDGQTTYAYYGTPRTGSWLEAASTFPLAPTSSAAGNVFINFGSSSSTSSETLAVFNRLHDVGVDCMGLPWATGIEQAQSQQGALIYGVNVRNCTYNLNVDNLSNGGGGAQNHGPIHDNAFTLGWPGTSMGVNQVVVTAGGSSYTSAPAVTITGCGTNPIAVASLTGTAVSAVTIVNTSGNGYGTNCVPGSVSVAFSGGGGTGAAATAVVQSPPPNIGMRLGGIHGSGGGLYWTNSNVGSNFAINRATGVTLDNSNETMLDTYGESAETVMCFACHTTGLVFGDTVMGLRGQGANEPTQTILQVGTTANSANAIGLAAFNITGSEARDFIVDNNVNGGICRNDIANLGGVTAYMRDGTKVFSMCRGIATTGMVLANPYYDCGSSCSAATEPRQYLPGKLVGGFVQSMSLGDTAMPVGVGTNGAFDTSNTHRSDFAYSGLVSVVLDPSQAVTVGDLVGISSNTVVSGQSIAGGVDMQTATFPVNGYAGWLLGTVVGYAGTDGAIAIPSAPVVSGATLTPSVSGSITYNYQLTAATGQDKTESAPSTTLTTTTGPSSLIGNVHIAITGLTSAVYNVYRLTGSSSSLPTLTPVMAGTQLAQITGLPAGTGYTWAPTAVFSGGGCTIEPQVEFYVVAGVISGYHIDGVGSGCTGTPTMTLTKSVCESGWIGQVNNTTTFTDYGFCGDGTAPPASGILAPLVNIDMQYNGVPGTGNVNGPASSIADHVAGFNGTSGTAIKDEGISALTLTTNTVPLWLQYLGTGADGAESVTSGTTALSGEKYYTTFNVSSGAVVTVNSWLTVHATGACTVNGSILANGATNALNTTGVGGAGSGGSGGGAAAGTLGGTSHSGVGAGATLGQGGSSGASSGGNGGAGSALTASSQRMVAGGGLGIDGLDFSGSAGIAGANSGGAAVEGGGGVTLICGSITGTGAIDVAGAPGNPPSANSEGAGSGGGSGVVILSSQAAETFGIAIDAGSAAGGQVSVPFAAAAGSSSAASGNQCTTAPVLTLGVTAGALSSCTVTVAGAACGSSPALNWSVLGGGGTGGTITPTWSGGAVASCTASGGSGYTAASYTTAGSGGAGGAGWSAEYSRW